MAIRTPPILARPFKNKTNVCNILEHMLYFSYGGDHMARTTDKQEKILEFLNQHIEEKGFPPTVREICAAVAWNIL